MNLLSTASNLTQYREKRDQICAQNWNQVYQFILLCYLFFFASLKFSWCTKAVNFAVWLIESLLPL